MNPSPFSLAILHAAHNRRRVLSLQSMLVDLAPLSQGVPMRVFDDRMPRERTWDEWQHELHPKVWGWALETAATHHVFMTDDLHVAPGFWEVLTAMTSAHPDAIIGLLSNHPAGPELARRGASSYRCNSWIVGPAYVVPRMHLEPFLAWYVQWLPQVDRKNYGDDSALNEWITRGGPGSSWHPLPTIIEHRGDLESTWQSGDQYSRERLSWRAVRSCVDTGRELLWTSADRRADLQAMARTEFWRANGPMLNVAQASEREADGWRGDPAR